MGEQCRLTAASPILGQVHEMYMYDLLQNFGFKVTTEELSVEEAVATLVHYRDNEMATMQIAQHVMNYRIHDPTLDINIKNALFGWITNIFKLGQAVLPLLKQHYWAI